MRFSRRAEAVSPFFAMEFGRRAAELEAAGHHVVKLNIGEPDFGAPPAFLRAVREVSDGRPLAYTGALGLTELRESIARFSGEQFGAPVDASRVVVTTGASAALLLACAALIDPGDDVLVSDPSYPCNRRFAESFGARVRLLETDPASHFQLDAAAVADAWSESTRGVMVASPANPTGTSLAYAELLDLCDVARRRGGWRIVDEIYLGLADGERRSVAADDPGAIVVNSFSKYFGMTGWRLGWAIVPDEMVPVAERLAQNYYICPPTPAQLAAVTCFEPATIAVAEERRGILRDRRELVLDGLARTGLAVPVPPDGAFYVYVDVSGTGLSASDFCDRALAEAHVALTPGKDFGVVGAEQYVRLSYAASTEELSLGIDRLGAFVASL
ncbi:aminotransferase class I/II-fold pyridoxal phosphate-dependent enzyme [Gordonia sp. HY002]|uniref:aminotransferase class I/II-fold pyridoxal phosphate-dependent enzyme n=1 Tax=Gordonia zhenghanii TaxID=2911516 RepID=UPI001EF0FD14|nr:aminotransferase class I/II-fold pyridoxal phosphate-dependent enzyme [Gordonia zhenghanii]MCF8571159.1 aminotransferase class I/II-fold pyridoxal phosphate-dependent enzyme [Gordonia zhenghanii]MCF8607183.1 aminotransferase class I/II-fold pyridoxal phosphate-dependent enzyme [Gordonia zhenghanii]